MKRYVTTVGAGLSLLIGVSGALVLFPNAVGARTSHAVAGNRVMVVSHVHTALLSSVRVVNRDLHRSSGVRATVRTNQQRGYGNGRRAMMARPTYGIASQRVGTAVVGASAVPTLRYGSQSRMTLLRQYTGTVRSGASSGIRYGMLYRTGRSGLYTGRMQTATGRTGHRCAGM